LYTVYGNVEVLDLAEVRILYDNIHSIYPSKVIPRGVMNPKNSNEVFFTPHTDIRYQQDFTDGSHRLLAIENATNEERLRSDHHGFDKPKSVVKILPPLQFSYLTLTRPRKILKVGGLYTLPSFLQTIHHRIYVC